MEFIKTEIEDVILIKPTIYEDSRGYFFESFREDKLSQFLNYKINFCQDNESKSSKGVLRGLHYQLPPFAQTKLVRVIKGRVFDVAVDIRKGSPTFGKYVAVELSEYNKYQLLIPKGFAHGFLTLEDNTIFSYKVDNYYSADHDRGIVYNDKNININWPVTQKELILSNKDKALPDLSKAILFDYSKDYYSD